MTVSRTVSSADDQVNDQFVAKTLCRQTRILNQRLHSESVATEVSSPIELPRDLHPHSPFRAPDWRWRLALHLVEQPRSRLRRLADDPVRMTVDYLRQRRRLRTDRGRQRLAAKRPGIVAARAIRFGNQVRRHEVEARLLAAQTDHEIADRFGLLPEVVALFERLFFDVRARLDATSYIQHTVIGPIIPPGREVPDRNRLVMLLAVRGGPAVLDVIIEANRPGVDPPLDARARRRIGLARLLVDGFSLPIARMSAGPRLLLLDRIEQIEHEAAARSTGTLDRPVMAPIPDDELAELMIASMSMGQSAPGNADHVPDDHGAGAVAVLDEGDPGFGLIIPWSFVDTLPAPRDAVGLSA